MTDLLEGCICKCYKNLTLLTNKSAPLVAMQVSNYFVTMPINIKQLKQKNVGPYDITIHPGVINRSLQKTYR